MPIAIQLTVLLASLQPRFHASAMALDAAFLRLGRQLETRRGDARTLEAASRSYPVVTFANDAVEAWIDRSQHRAFSPRVEKSLGQELAEGGRGFVRGIARIPGTIQATRVIPALLRSFASLLETAGGFLDTNRRGMTVRERLLKIADASGRSPKGPGFFDALLDFAPRLPRIAAAATVVLGSLARFVSTLGSNDGAALRTLAGGAESMAGRMRPVIAELFPPSGETSAPRRLEDTLRAIVEGVGVALLAMPGLILYLGPLLTRLAFGLRLRIVEALSKIEGEYGWGLRKMLLELFFVDLEQLRRDSVDWLRGGSELVLSYLSFGLSFAELYLAELLDGIRLVARDISETLNFVTAVLTWIGRIDTAVFASILLAGLPAAPPRKPMPPRIERFPQVFADLFGKSKDKGSLLATFRGSRDLTKSLVSDVLKTGEALLVDAERGFDQLREDAASQDLSGRFLGLVETSGKLTSDLLLIEHLWQATHSEPTGFEGVSRAFEQTLFHGGFSVVGFAIQGFVAELDAFWRAEKNEEIIAGKAAPPPVSPHHLARRARLGTVRVPKVAIRMRGRALDADLRSRVAERVRRAVAEIYQAGKAQLAAAPPAG